VREAPLRLTFFKLHGFTDARKGGASRELSHDETNFGAVASRGAAL
jgi:hypothetical protein